jgi:hypothetical protein
MKEIFNKLSSLPLPVGYIVHIGAGQCSELQAYQDLDPQKIILVEADNQQATHLKKITQSKKIIDVLATAIAEKEESRTLKILTNQRDSSLLIPEKLLSYYPSLTIASEQTVTTITLEKLLQKYTFDNNFHHLLIIETPGIESLIVKSTSIEKLQPFSGIRIRTSTEKLYKKEEQKNIIDFLESCGFDCNHQEDELYSPVFSKLYFQRNNEKIELQHSQEKIKQLISERDVQSKSATEKQSQIEQLTKAKDEQIKLATERQQIVKKITAERDAQAKSVAEKQNQIEQQAKTKEQEKSKQTSDHKQKIEQINQEHDKIISDLKCNKNKLQLELEEAKQTVSLSLKLQMLKEKDLQQRFQSALETQETSTKTTTSKEESDNTIYAPNVYGEYQKISRLSIKKETPPFILLDSKSLPRSGLHYMKNTLARIVGENFSFCEWYQEPGCCKRMPCALTGYANNCQKTGYSGVRLIKSHDFNFHDPIFSTSYSLRRVVLVRDPLFVLTSYFVIEQLLNYKAVLQEKGIYMEKIWLSHETEVLATAYQLMDQFFVAPKEITLNNWLNKKVAYINGFLKKWSLTNNDQSFSYLVNYNEIDSFIKSLLLDIQDFFPDETRVRMNFFVENSEGGWHARTDPFLTTSKKVSEYLRNNSKLFIQAAKKVISAD